MVGHDLGGGVAQILAVRHPELVDGLVLTNAIAYDSWPISGVKAMRAMGPLVERLPVEVFRYILRAFLQGGHDDGSRAQESFDEHWPYYEAGGGGAAFVRQARSLNQQDTVAVDGRASRTSTYRRGWPGGPPTSSSPSATATAWPTSSALLYSASRAASTSPLKTTPRKLPMP